MGELPPKGEDQRIQVLKQPVGVVVSITPWNFPAAMTTRKLLRLSLRMHVIVKPPKETPLTAAKIMECAEEAGIPKGVVNMVVTPNEA